MKHLVYEIFTRLYLQYVDYLHPLPQLGPGC